MLSNHTPFWLNLLNVQMHNFYCFIKISIHRYFRSLNKKKTDCHMTWIQHTYYASSTFTQQAIKCNQSVESLWWSLTVPNIIQSLFKIPTNIQTVSVILVQFYIGEAYTINTLSVTYFRRKSDFLIFRPQTNGLRTIIYWKYVYRFPSQRVNRL